MCMSPHEIKSARLEEYVKAYNDYADEAEREGDHGEARYLRKKADAFAAILKERAEDGSYDSDVDPRTGDERV